jgi:hypothetical protein
MTNEEIYEEFDRRASHGDDQATRIEPWTDTLTKEQGLALGERVREQLEREAA